ncbi:MAG: CHAT domain-containing protein [Acidobacteria bacterium]|jgi:hypothetical protein|nr:CHAT domain-containing protein [Acidobacteriota bacterium]
MSAARRAPRRPFDAERLAALEARFADLSRTDAARAAVAAARLARYAGATGDPRAAGAAEHAAGVLAHLAGRTGAAQRHLRRAFAIFRDADRPLDAGDAQRVLVDVAVQAGDAPAARAAARAARACYARAGEAGPRRLGALALNLGNLHHRLDRHREALAAYREARGWYARAREPRRLAFVDYNEANILATLDRTPVARRGYEAARAVFAAERLTALELQADYALAGLDLLEGRLDPALARLEAVRARQAGLGDPLGAAHCELDAAEALLRLNRAEEADLRARSAAAAFTRARRRGDLAQALGARGGAALQLGRPAVAARLFARGRALLDAEGNRVGAALLAVGQAQALLAAADRVASRDAARRAAARAAALAGGAAALLSRRGLASRAARALAVAAAAERDAGRPGRAAARAAEALRIARRRRDPRVELGARVVLASLAERAGRLDAAFRELAAADRCIARMRAGVSTEESRLAFALDKGAVYEAILSNRLRRGGARAVRQALAFAERGKARALAEQIARGPRGAGGARRAGARKLAARLEELERELAVAEARLEGSEVPAGVRAEAGSRLSRLVVERAGALARLAAEDPLAALLLGGEVPGPAAAMAALRPDEVVLEYAVADGRFQLFAIERGRVEAFRNLATVAEVHDLADRLRFQLGRGVLGDAFHGTHERAIHDACRLYLGRLHDALLGPLDGRFHGRALRIVPHGALHGLPFHAFESGGVPLIEHGPVSYAPSLAVLALLARPRRGAVRTAAPLVLGVADRRAPAIEAEVEAVGRRLGGAVVLRGPEATRAALDAAGASPPVLHVACHGMFAESGAFTGALRLGDTWIALPDIYRLQGTAEIVVLSGCDTGRGTVHSGDEWVSLVRGFLQAGARTVVAAMWDVHDLSAARTMDDFYARLAEGEPVGTALAAAQLQARRRDPSPLRWAPFMVVGNPWTRWPAASRSAVA